MSGSIGARVTPVSGFSARLVAGALPVEAVHRPEIEAAWAAALAEKPRMFNGRVLLAERAAIRDGVLDVDFREVAFATLIWLRGMVREGATPPLLNVFGAAAVISSDGAILLGRMASHTANAGQVYFPAGTPDLADVAEAHVDLDASTLRELCEETGLAPPGVRAAGSRLVVTCGELVACVRPFRSELAGAALAAVVERYLSTGGDGELDGVELVRRANDLTDRSPAYVHAAVSALLERI